MSKMSARNREIYSAIQNGKSLDDAAAQFGLTRNRVAAILKEEELKRRYSLEEAYRNLRRQTRPPGGS